MFDDESAVLRDYAHYVADCKDTIPCHIVLFTAKPVFTYMSTRFRVVFVKEMRLYQETSIELAARQRIAYVIVRL